MLEKDIVSILWPHKKTLCSILSTVSSHHEAASGDSLAFSKNQNRRQCAIPGHALARSSVFTTSLEKVGKDSNTNGKSLCTSKMLTTHRLKTPDSALRHSSGFRPGIAPFSRPCHCTTQLTFLPECGKLLLH